MPVNERRGELAGERAMWYIFRKQRSRLLENDAPSRECMKKLTLHLLSEAFTINKLPQFAEIPTILSQGEMCFIIRTDEELCVICPDFMAPNNVQQELGWRCLKVEGALKMQDIGVLASLSQPLAEANIPMLAVSTFVTDYIFVMEEHLVNAVQALQKAGHEFSHDEK